MFDRKIINGENITTKDLKEISARFERIFANSKRICVSVKVQFYFSSKVRVVRFLFLLVTFYYKLAS